MNSLENRTIIFGDIHGCFSELQELLEKCEITSTDRLISLGDLVDRGDQPREVIEFFMQHEAVSGNHDERAVGYYEKWRRKGSPTHPADIQTAVKFNSPTHLATFLALQPSHFEWLARLPLFIRLPPEACGGRRVSLVHAGCLPDLALEDQDPHILRHVMAILPSSEFAGSYDELGRLQHGYRKGSQKVQSWWLNRAPPAARYWATLYDSRSEGIIIFGHAGLREPAFFRGEDGTLHALGIDTGACFGRKLTALILPDWRLVSVSARRTYAEDKRVKLFTISPGIEVYS